MFNICHDHMSKWTYLKGQFLVLYYFQFTFTICLMASLFSVVYKITDSAHPLKRDLSRINKWGLQWKMSLNPDPTKQTQEIFFSRKISQRNHPDLFLNNNIVKVTTFHKHLGMIFDSKLRFDENVRSVLKK